MATSLSPSISKRGDVTVIAFDARFESLDEFTLDQVRELVLEAAKAATPPKIVIDLSCTKFFGSSFIEVLFRVWNRVNGADGKFALSGLTPYCREVLQITHLDKLWPMFPNVDAAVAAIG